MIEKNRIPLFEDSTAIMTGPKTEAELEQVGEVRKGDKRRGKFFSASLRFLSVIILNTG